MSRRLKAKAEAVLTAERGTVFKARGAAVEVALAYPNTYHVGMSNLGVHQMYFGPEPAQRHSLRARFRA